MDFYKIKAQVLRNGVTEVSPDFKVCKSKDLMIRGKSFYAIWDEEKGMWSTDEYDVQRLVDKELYSYADSLRISGDNMVHVKSMSDFSSNSWTSFKKYIASVSDCNHTLDERVIFQDTEVKRDDYASKRLPYALSYGSCPAYTILSTTLYEPDELQKIEWAVGSVISGDAKNIQKFLVFYGEGGTGKSTMLNIIQKIFEGYYCLFDAKALASNNNSFSTEVFRGNPLVAIQHDGDLSKIEDNTKINSIVSHEEMIMNEKYKSSYSSRINAFLFMGTNKPVKISDAKSGIIRRLIDVKPSGRLIPPDQYWDLYNKIDFELGDIAGHCLKVYQELGPHYYASYRPMDMIFKTDVFFNFVEENYYVFKEEDTVSLSRAYDMYKQYCDQSTVDYKLPKYKFREELKNYFKYFQDRGQIDGKPIRSCYSGFMAEKFDVNVISEKLINKDVNDNWIILKEQKSLLDDILADCPAQLASDEEIQKPTQKWEKVRTILKDIQTSKTHYVKPPLNHIFIDFDLKDPDGKKSLKLNLEAAKPWPNTYAETSKSGEGLHLHYIYSGDVSKLSNLYSDGIEVKVCSGNSSLRRKLTLCNDIPIATISSGLPLKGEKMLNPKTVESEKHLRALIKKNLKKEIHPGTKPSIDFIQKILEDAYNSGLVYDVTDLRPKVMTFALNSTHWSDYCLKAVNKMLFKSEVINDNSEYYEDQRLVFFDVEVFPNLFLVCWKYDGEDSKKVTLFNPTPAEMEKLFKLKLIGFNNRDYDNHICYARYLGYNNEELFKLSQRIIGKSSNAKFGEAYNLSYTDIYDFSSAGHKQSLKKWEIELGLKHQELDLPWDQPVPEELWPLVAEYCGNDVDATEAVFHHLAADWAARQILAEISGLTCNDTTNQHTTRIIFGTERHPQSEFNYPDLSLEFPGYRFENGTSFYKGEKVNEGGFVYAQPGIYGHVPVLDVESMHPHSIKAMNLFGKYTDKFVELMEIRLMIKHNQLDKVRTMMNGKLAKYVDNPALISGLKDALKTAINSVYGLTFTKFDNPFRDPRNVDNIVAKRGALFMVDLKLAVEAKGFTVAHIKTDSIKIPDATPEIIAFVSEFGKKYGYNFEHESTYDKMCLVNDAVYIAKYDTAERCEKRYGYVPEKNVKHGGEWTATGTQFQQPYVFKTLFSREPITFEDKCETRSVSNARMYLDFNEDLDEGQHDYQFIGKTGLFCPIKSGCGGGQLFRVVDNKYSSVAGSKGYRWKEASTVKALDLEGDIDIGYYRNLVDAAISDISKYGDFEMFVSDEPYDNEALPMCYPCGEPYESCQECPYYYGIHDVPGTGICDKEKWPCDDTQEKVNWCISCPHLNHDTKHCDKMHKTFSKIHDIGRFPF